NVLVSVEGEVKLADFGIARALRAAAPGIGLHAGTPGYMAPEVEKGHVGDHRADIYSLGVTLLVALTGWAPADATRRAAELRAVVPGASAELQTILARAVAPLASERFLSAGELERALSFELARRHPAFTPSVVAGVVRDAMRAERRPVGGPGTEVVHSMAL